MTTTADGIRENQSIEELKRELAAKQAQIDALMLEFCPDEMTDEQRANWARNQRRSHEKSLHRR